MPDLNGTIGAYEESTGNALAQSPPVGYLYIRANVARRTESSSRCETKILITRHIACALEHSNKRFCFEARWHRVLCCNAYDIENDESESSNNY